MAVCISCWLSLISLNAVCISRWLAQLLLVGSHLFQSSTHLLLVLMIFLLMGLHLYPVKTPHTGNSTLIVDFISLYSAPAFLSKECRKFGPLKASQHSVLILYSWRLCGWKLGEAVVSGSEWSTEFDICSKPKAYRNFLKPTTTKLLARASIWTKWRSVL